MTKRSDGLLVFLPRLAIFPMLALAAFATYWFLLLSSSAWRQIEALATANSDAVQWSLAQAEVELLVLSNLFHEAELHPEHASAKELRNRFDVFFSRIQLLRSAPVYTEVRAVPEILVALDEIDAFLMETAPVLDSTGLDGTKSLAGLSGKVEALRPKLRMISLAGVRISAAASERQRDRVAKELARLAIFALTLFVTLVVLLVALAYLLSLAGKRTAQVRAGQERMRSVVSAAFDGILVASDEGRVIEYNDAAVRIFGYTREEALGKDLAGLILPGHLRDAHRSDTQQFWRTGDSSFVNRGLVMLSGVSKAGRTFPVEMSVALAKSDRRPTLVYFVRDISSRIEAEQELVAARDRARKGEKAKAEVLAVMSHEMRTPLNGIIGSLDLLSESGPTPRQRKFIEAMQISGQMLLDRVNTVLGISRLDAGLDLSERRVFDPLALTRSIAETLESQAQLRRNHLKVTAVGPALTPCLGDGSKLQQVLVNLIGNAIKFTENGTIEVEIERQSGSDEIEFRVIDTGIGIAEKHLGRVFDDFVTLDPSYGRKVEGTGLGLGITRRLVHALQGVIGVESEEGTGSVFWVRLPLPAAPGALVATGPFDARPGGTARLDLSVLVIEDNAINRLVAREMLESLHCRVTEAQDGEEGVAIALGRPFDAILMDISMPRLDGVRAARQIRQGNGPNAATPIIALTAHALAEDLDRFRSAGMSDALVKPVSRPCLEAALSGLARHAARDGGGALPSSAVADDLDGLLGSDRKDAIVRTAHEDLERMLTDLKDRDMGAEAARFASALHQMVGLASLVGFTDLVGHLRAAETALRQHEAGALTAALDAARSALRGQPTRADVPDNPGTGPRGA